MSLKLSDPTVTLFVDNVAEVPDRFRALITQSLADPGEVILDGEFHSFRTPGDLQSIKPGRMAGMYQGSLDTFSGTFGSRRPGEYPPCQVTFEVPESAGSSAEQVPAARHQAKQARQVGYEAAAYRAEQLWQASESALPDSEYLAARGVLDACKAHPGEWVRYHPSGVLVVPMRDAAGKLWNMERISADGRKKSLDHARTTGLGLWIPRPPTAGERWYVVEGVCKAMAVFLATGTSVLCGFSAHNLSSAIAEHAAARIGQGVIAADNDAAGRTAAGKAMTQFPGLRVAYPPEGAGDWNDLLVQQGMASLTAALTPEAVRGEGPAPLRREPPDPEPFPMAALGGILSPAATSLKRIIQAPDALIGSSVLATASLCVQPHANVVIDGRVSPLSVFMVTIAASGERKSAVDTVALKPVIDKQRELVEVYRQDHRLHEIELRAFEKNEKELLKEKVVDLAEIRRNREAQQAAIDALGEAPQPPLSPHLLVSDPTAEGLFKLFERGQPSLGLFSDEAGLLIGGHALMKETRLRTIAAWSKLWDGRPLDRVRSQDGSTLLYDRRLALHLMAQPLVANELFTDPLYTDQGFMSRVLCAWPASTAGSRRYVIADPTQDPAIVRYWETLRQLLNRPYPLRANTRNELTPRCISLSAPAKTAWVSYVNTIESQLGDGEVLEPIRGLAAKAGEQVARVAGVLTLLGDPDAGDIGIAAVEAGIALLDFYLTETLRIYRTGVGDPDLNLAAKCLRWMQDHGHTVIWPALLYQFGPNPVSDSHVARKMINLLEQHRWLVRVPEGGKVDGVLRRELWTVVREG